MDFSNKKFLIFPTLIFGFMIIIIGVFMLFRQPKSETIETKPTITSFPTSVSGKVPTPTFAAPTFTGESEADLPDELEKQVASSFDLIQEVPVQGENFKLDYDYGQAKFIVTLQRPFSESQAAFNAWIEENGFSQIPQEDFIFQ